MRNNLWNVISNLKKEKTILLVIFNIFNNICIFSYIFIKKKKKKKKRKKKKEKIKINDY